MVYIRPIIINTNENGLLIVDINVAPDWDSFDKLITFLKRDYDAEVLEKIDGPDARRWRLQTSGIAYELIHDDPYGTTLESISFKSNEIVKTIAKDLATRFEDPIHSN